MSAPAHLLVLGIALAHDMPQHYNPDSKLFKSQDGKPPTPLYIHRSRPPAVAADLAPPQATRSSFRTSRLAVCSSSSQDGRIVPSSTTSGPSTSSHGSYVPSTPVALICVEVADASRSGRTTGLSCSRISSIATRRCRTIARCVSRGVPSSGFLDVVADRVRPHALIEVVDVRTRRAGHR